MIYDMGNQNVGLIQMHAQYLIAWVPKLKFFIRENHLYPPKGPPINFSVLRLLLFQGESDGIWAWTRFNQLFNYLPLAAMIEKKIICMHGGIGRSITSVEQIEKLERPITMDVGSIILMDLLWYMLKRFYHDLFFSFFLFQST